jgi:hypothetical protein
MSAQSLGATARRCVSGHCEKVQGPAEGEGSKFVGKITNHLMKFSRLFMYMSNALVFQSNGF